MALEVFGLGEAATTDIALPQDHGVGEVLS